MSSRQLVVRLDEDEGAEGEWRVVSLDKGVIDELGTKPREYLWVFGRSETVGVVQSDSDINDDEIGLSRHICEEASVSSGDFVTVEKVVPKQGEQVIAVSEDDRGNEFRFKKVALGMVISRGNTVTIPASKGQAEITAHVTETVSSGGQMGFPVEVTEETEIYLRQQFDKYVRPQMLEEAISMFDRTIERRDGLISQGLSVFEFELVAAGIVIAAFATMAASDPRGLFINIPLVAGFVSWLVAVYFSISVMTSKKERNIGISSSTFRGFLTEEYVDQDFFYRRVFNRVAWAEENQIENVNAEANLLKAQVSFLSSILLLLMAVIWEVLNAPPWVVQESGVSAVAIGLLLLSLVVGFICYTLYKNRAPR